MEDHRLKQYNGRETSQPRRHLISLVISSYNSVFGNNLFCIYLTMAFLLGAEAIGVSLCGVCLLGILQRGHVGTVSDMVSRYLRGWVEVEG